jgi:hypothetical protein
MGDSEVNINDLLTRLFDAFNRHDLDAIMELFAEDAILDMPGGRIGGNGSSVRLRCAKGSPIGLRASPTCTMKTLATS